MVAWKVDMVRGSIYLPQLDLWCDAHEPVNHSFVSHAHFDHLAAHRRIITSEGTRRLMAVRLPGEREEVVLPFEQAYELNAETRLQLYPAGHIFGSAMLYLSRDHESFLYTGDFKLREGRSAEKCRPPRADVVVMETTFGLPHYVFPPTRQVLQDIVHFCQTALEQRETPVLFGYSLGKSQELLSSLSEADLPIMLHPQTLKMTQVYEQLGVTFPIYRPFDLNEIAGHVVICPPQANQSAWLRKIIPRRAAAITGWAIDPSAIYRYQCQAAFPLSDHADFQDLLSFVELVQPRKVLTVHGFVQEFARTLRDRGIEAWALGRDNQMEMTWSSVSPRAASPSPEKPSSLAGEAGRPGDFRAFAIVAEKIQATPKKSEKTHYLMTYFQSLSSAELAAAAVAFTGHPFPASDTRTINCGWSIIKSALLAVSGLSEGDYRVTYQRYSDSGQTAEAILRGHVQPASWEISALPDFFSTLAAARGPTNKQNILEARLKQLDPLEAKYLIKIITGDLRIGLKEGLVEEALAVAFGASQEEVREANMLCGDLGLTARAAREGTLKTLELRPFQPIHFMLASPEASAEAILARFAEPVWVEEKYDGIRCQVHKVGNRVEFYSRELRRITGQFPDLVAKVQKMSADFIGDGELLAWDQGRALPFAELQKRLGRKGDDLFLGSEIPVSLWLYDLLGHEGKSLLKLPLQDRRERLESFSWTPGVACAPRQLISGAAGIDAAFYQSRQRGNEGLMVKDPQSLYLPGRRGLAWAKLKKAYATLDVVVVGVEWGHGKRRKVLSDYTFAIREEGTNQLLPIGKAYSGLTDAEIAHYTEFFLEHTLEEKGRYRLVEPTIVLEVAFDAIQSSSRHASGYALRFPRILRIRDDKSVKEIDTLAHCQKLAGEVWSKG